MHGTGDIRLGQSAAPLYGPWKFTVGDPPADSVTHAPLWAGPGFDVSKWETVDLSDVFTCSSRNSNNPWRSAGYTFFAMISMVPSPCAPPLYFVPHLTRPVAPRMIPY